MECSREEIKGTRGRKTRFISVCSENGKKLEQIVGKTMTEK